MDGIAITCAESQEEEQDNVAWAPLETGPLRERFLVGLFIGEQYWRAGGKA